MKVFCTSAIICSLLILVECHLESKHNPNGPVYDGLYSVLEEAAKHTQMFANDLTHRMNQTFVAIKEKVEQWKNNNAFTKQLESFQAEGNHCIKENELVLAQFTRNLVKTYDSCSQEVKQLVSDNLTSMKDSVSLIKNAPRKVEDISYECFSQKEIDLAASSLCVVTRIAEIQFLTAEANLLVEKFINHGLEEVEMYAAKTCKGIQDLDKEFVEVYNKIRTCIKNYKQ
ncbi:uncharacterized protein LOC129940622 [Eupeodes corollae]|uniref:uncharacterized protein LOC129940622 n=1 Tax=Eupeodes corollae TaxID=290404 RepID=UPI002490A2FD|nr:uncharacterized protein LOC129940622 [Eupeodes corollae]